jgi:rhodanese-related sulfurtransferase
MKQLCRIFIITFLFGVTVGLNPIAVSADDLSFITASQLFKNLGNPNLVIVDVRDTNDWQSSNYKIKGAARGIPEEFESWSRELPQDKILVLY